MAFLTAALLTVGYLVSGVETAARCGRATVHVCSCFSWAHRGRSGGGRVHGERQVQDVRARGQRCD